MKTFQLLLLLLVHTLTAEAVTPAGSPDTLTGPHAEFAAQYARFDIDHPFQPAAPGWKTIPLVRRSPPLKKEVFGYLPYWFRNRWNLLDYNLLSTISYSAAEAQADGGLGNMHGWPRYAGDPTASADVISMINAAHARGVRVVLCITNFTGSEIASIVSSPVNRARLIDQSLTAVQAAGADGVNIDFEGVLNSSRNDLTTFMRELAENFHFRLPGSQVSCAPTDFDLRSNGGDWDLAAIRPYVDLFFIQGYGYHYSGSTTSGPIGLLPNTGFWGSVNVTTLINNVVLARIDTAKVVLGTPHFGYRWPTAGPDPKSATGGTGRAFYYPDAVDSIARYGRQWDATGLNPWYRALNGSQWYQGWYDDPQSMEQKYQFVFARRLMGVGMWALGQDGSNHDIWDMIARYFVDSSRVVTVEEGGGIPFAAELEPCYPNPFNSMTVFGFSVPAPAGGDRGGSAGWERVRLSVSDLLGREVAVLVNEPLAPGRHQIRFDATGLPSGVYFARLTMAGGSAIRKALLLR